MRKRAGPFGVALAMLAMAAPARPLDQAGLVDRARIEDLLTRYYYSLGHGAAEDFARFYTADAEMILGKTRYTGRAAIAGAYQALAKADIPQRKAFAFNVVMSNPLIVVDGRTAAARLIFTEFVVDKPGDPPRVLVQGKEFDRLVKIDGEWRIARRLIAGAEQGAPADWPE